jgi:hypothetical protein
MTLQNIRQKSGAAAAAIGLGALLVGCSAGTGSVSSIAKQGFSEGGPVAVSCEPGQRAVVRQVVVNGGMQAQVQCETVAPAFANQQAVVGYATASPVAYQSGFQPAGYVQAPIENTQLVRAAYPATRVAAPDVAPRRVTYQRAPERIAYRPRRSVKKSAVIIGSSAGVGAGIGAAVGGKKGAGVGALIAGGGAALWDQITRRK